jgi:hypothetical protein
MTLRPGHFPVGFLPHPNQKGKCVNKQYNINLDVKFGFLELIDVPSLIAGCRETWFNQTLCQVNDCVVRLGVMEGEFHWHKHDQEDEFFFRVAGEVSD